MGIFGIVASALGVFGWLEVMNFDLFFGFLLFLCFVLHITFQLFLLFLLFLLCQWHRTALNARL